MGPNPERCAYNYLHASRNQAAGCSRWYGGQRTKESDPYKQSCTETYLNTAWRQSSYNWILPPTSQHAPDLFPQWLTGLAINVCADPAWDRTMQKLAPSWVKFSHSNLLSAGFPKVLEHSFTTQHFTNQPRNWKRDQPFSIKRLNCNSENILHTWKSDRNPYT